MSGFNLKRPVFIAVACVVFGSMAWTVRYVNEERAFDPYPELTSMPRNAEGKQFSIALIGDSWVEHERLDRHLADALAEGALPDVKILSFGQDGAVSRAIYRNLMAPPAAASSSSAVLEDPDIR